jgi:hypothetical protein
MLSRAADLLVAILLQPGSTLPKQRQSKEQTGFQSAHTSFTATCTACYRLTHGQQPPHSTACLGCAM